ncbi:MAG: agmatine deiminase family protein, partial [Bacteroidetes bacterium]|nr:agmatine deiminase family protein [Bacteroidota bacterium]
GRRKKLLEKFELSVGDTIEFVAASSYLNYIISNGIVIIPKYWEPGKPESINRKDTEALEIFKRVFPEREIIQINPLPFNWDGGGMHCRNQTQPKIK